MPLVYQQNINETTKLGVWHITESEAFFLQQVNGFVTGENGKRKQSDIGFQTWQRCSPRHQIIRQYPYFFHGQAKVGHAAAVTRVIPGPP